MNRPSNYLLEEEADVRAREINFAKTRNFRPRPKSDDTKLSEGIERSARKQPTCPPLLHEEDCHRYLPVRRLAPSRAYARVKRKMTPRLVGDRGFDTNGSAEPR